MGYGLLAIGLFKITQYILLAKRHRAYSHPLLSVLVFSFCLLTSSLIILRRYFKPNVL